MCPRPGRCGRGRRLVRRRRAEVGGENARGTVPGRRRRRRPDARESLTLRLASRPGVKSTPRLNGTTDWSLAAAARRLRARRRPQSKRATASRTVSISTGENVNESSSKTVIRSRSRRRRPHGRRISIQTVSVAGGRPSRRTRRRARHRTRARTSATLGTTISSSSHPTRVCSHPHESRDRADPSRSRCRIDVDERRRRVRPGPTRFGVPARSSTASRSSIAPSRSPSTARLDRLERDSRRCRRRRPPSLAAIRSPSSPSPARHAPRTVVVIAETPSPTTSSRARANSARRGADASSRRVCPESWCASVLSLGYRARVALALSRARPSRTSMCTCAATSRSLARRPRARDRAHDLTVIMNTPRAPAAATRRRVSARAMSTRARDALPRSFCARDSTSDDDASRAGDAERGKK